MTDTDVRLLDAVTQFDLAANADDEATTRGSIVRNLVVFIDCISDLAEFSLNRCRQRGKSKYPRYKIRPLHTPRATTKSSNV